MSSGVKKLILQAENLDALCGNSLQIYLLNVSHIVVTALSVHILKIHIFLPFLFTVCLNSLHCTSVFELSMANK